MLCSCETHIVADVSKLVAAGVKASNQFLPVEVRVRTGKHTPENSLAHDKGNGPRDGDIPRKKEEPPDKYTKAKEPI